MRLRLTDEHDNERPLEEFTDLEKALERMHSIFTTTRREHGFRKMNVPSKMLITTVALETGGSGHLHLESTFNVDTGQWLTSTDM